MYVRQRWRVDTSEATRTDTGIDAAQRQPAKCVSDRWGFGRLAGPVHEPQRSRKYPSDYGDIAENASQGGSSVLPRFLAFLAVFSSCP